MEMPSGRPTATQSSKQASLPQLPEAASRATRAAAKQVSRSTGGSTARQPRSLLSMVLRKSIATARQAATIAASARRPAASPAGLQTACAKPIRPGTARPGSDTGSSTSQNAGMSSTWRHPSPARLPSTSYGLIATGAPMARPATAPSWPSANGRAMAAATRAAASALAANHALCRDGSGAASTRPTIGAATAKVTPPIQVELSKPAAARMPSSGTASVLPPCARCRITSTATTTQQAEVRCWGTQADWVSQPPRSAWRTINAPDSPWPSSQSSHGRSVPAALNSTTAAQASDRPPIALAMAIANASDENAVTPVIAASAAQPPMPRTAASSAALKCHR